MSLDVYLSLGEPTTSDGSGIFVREDGRVKEISRQEWDEKFPNREPIVAEQSESDTVFSANITHNLNDMASAAGIYQHLWRPEELGITKAGELIEPLQNGFFALVTTPVYYQSFNPSNGWGSYKDLVSFVEEYLAACKKYPHATVRVTR